MAGAAHKGIIGICLSTCLATGAHAAGGAYAVDDAAIGSVGECHAESWIAVASNGDFVGVTQPACVVKLGVPVELTSTLQAAHRGGEWATLTGVQGKFILLPLSTFAVALTISTISIPQMAVTSPSPMSPSRSKCVTISGST